MQEMKNSKLHEKERLPLLAHEEKNAPKKMTIEFMKGVQCAESTKPTLYTVIMNEKEKSPSPMRRKKY